MRDEVPSTQEVARRAVRPDRPAVAIAHRQTRGRGRSGSEWVSAPRSVAVSLAMWAAWEPVHWPLVPLTAGVAARRVLGDAVGLKWPNDVLLDGRKVGGILAEATGEVVVVGLGLNLYWPDAPGGYGALYGHDPSADAGPRLARAWADELLGELGRPADEWPREEYGRSCVTLGQRITWQPDGVGWAVDVAHDGALMVELAEGGRIELRSGEVRHVRPAT